MIKKGVIYFMVLFAFCSCLEPYNVNLPQYNDILIVDALITNENTAHKVVLSKSISNIDQEVLKVSGATVKITDDQGGEYILEEIEQGVYVTDVTTFQAKIGYSYQLEIRTKENIVYKSIPCKMPEPSEISKINFEKDKQWNNDNTKEYLGISIQIDGAKKGGGYFRWMYEEAWKFRVPYFEGFDFDENKELISILPENIYCWKSNNSNEILIHSTLNQSTEEVKKKQILFIPAELSDRLLMRYSVLIKQLSISKEEFDFWDELKKSTVDVGGTFGKQPFSVKGNIYNTENNSSALGYFQVGSVVSQRLYINYEDIMEWGLPYYMNDCELLDIKIDDKSLFTIYDIYDYYVLNGLYVIYEPIYPLMGGEGPIGLSLAMPICSDCSKTGSNIEPYFWVD